MKILRMIGVSVVALGIFLWGSYHIPGVVGSRPAYADIFSITKSGMGDVLRDQKMMGASLIHLKNIEFNGVKLPITIAESEKVPREIITLAKQRIGTGFYSSALGPHMSLGGYYDDGTFSLLLAMRQPDTESSVMYSCSLGSGSLCKFIKQQAEKRPVGLDEYIDQFQPDPASQCLDRIVLGKHPVSCKLYHCRSTLTMASLKQWYVDTGKRNGWQANSLPDKPAFLMMEKDGSECYLSFKDDDPVYTTYILMTMEKD